MIVPLAVIAWLVSSPDTTLKYTALPRAVVSVTTWRWREDASPIPLRREAPAGDGSLIIEVDEAGPLLITFARADGAYLLDGPVVADAVDHAARPVAVRWRRTVTGSLGADSGRLSSLSWLPAHRREPDTWPRCFVAAGDAWQCWGIALDEPGVICGDARGHIVSAVVEGMPSPALKVSAWGRLALVSRSDGGSPGKVGVAMEYPVAPPDRPQAVRWDIAVVAGTRATPVGDAASVWLTGPSPPPDAWLAIRASRASPTFLPLDELALGPPDLVVSVVLDQDDGLEGKVTGAAGEPAAAALLSLFRVIDPPGSATQEEGKARRVRLEETTADDDGRFRFESPGNVLTEIVAWHAQLGRASVRLSPPTSHVAITLRAAGTVRGRVMKDGLPLPDVTVVSTPDLAAFASATDETRLKGGDGRSGPDGRFGVALAAEGGGELRVGGGAWPLRRIPLPRSAQGVVDVGDIDLGSAIDLTLVFDIDVGCQVRAVGPLGRGGLQFVAARLIDARTAAVTLPEEGQWAFSLACGDHERDVSPAVVTITPAMSGTQLRLSVRSP